METDRAFAEIFGHRPDWLARLTGAEFPLEASARPEKFKASLECDLLLVPVDEAAAQVVCEFQFYHDQSIFVRADLARLLRRRELNPVEECRKRDYVPKRAEAVIVFGERGHIPAGAQEFPHIRWVVLAERLPEIEREEPGSALASLLRPVVEGSDAEVEGRAAADYHGLREHAALSEEERHCFSTMFVQFLMQRFKFRTPEEIGTMIAELVPVEETRAGRELIERGADEIVLVLLERVCGGLDEARRTRVVGLPVEKAKQLALALLEFHSVNDLDAWFEVHA